MKNLELANLGSDNGGAFISEMVRNSGLLLELKQPQVPEVAEWIGEPGSYHGSLQ
jgi:hypothetical protein